MGRGRMPVSETLKRQRYENQTKAEGIITSLSVYPRLQPDTCFSPQLPHLYLGISVIHPLFHHSIKQNWYFIMAHTVDQIYEAAVKSQLLPGVSLLAGDKDGESDS